MKEMKEKSGGQKKIFKKLLSVLLVFALMITANGSWNLLRARAENGPEFPWMTFSFDDRGNPDNSYVTLEGAGLSGTQKMNPWEPVEVVPGETYVVSLTPPEERQGFEPIVEVRIHIEGADDEVFSNVRFWDGQGEADPNLELNDGKFEITIPSEKFNGANVDIWWCDYDRVGPNDMEYCVEVVRNGEGEAFLDNFDEYFSVWEYEEYDNQGQPIRNWGGQKMIIPRECFEEGGAGEEGLSLKFASFEGFSFGRLQVNEEGGEPFVLDAIELEEGQEPVYLLTKDSFDGNGYLNMEVYFDGGMPSFNVFYDDYAGAVNISGVEYETPVKLNQGAVDPFTFGETYTFELVPPENQDEYIVEIRVHNPEAPDTVYSNREFWDEANDKQAEANLEIEDDRFTFTVPQEENFCGVDMVIWWSEFDRAGASDQEYCIEVHRNGDGEAFVKELPDCSRIWEFEEYDEQSGTSRNWGREKIFIPRSAFETGEIGENGLDIQFGAYDGYAFRRLQVNIEGSDPIELNADDLQEDQDPIYHLTKNDFNFDGYLNMGVNFDGGMPSFNVFYDDYVGAVNISGVEYETPVKLNQGPVDPFTFGGIYTFELVPPENRTEDCEYIVEIRVYNPEAPATVYSNRDFWDEANDKQAEANLEIEDDRFTFTVPQEEDFCGVDINIWWSDYDRICGNDEEYCIQVMNDRNGDSYFAGKDYFMAWEYNGIDSGSGETYGYGNQKFMIPKSDVESSAAELKFSPYEGYVFAELKVDNTPEGTIYSAEDLGENPVFVLSKNLFDGGGNLTVEARYSSNTQPGPGGEPGNEKECAKQFAKFVSDGIYMFGDWDGDEEVDKDDLLLGMAQQIYYPEFNEPNRNLKKAYSEIQSYEDLKAKITIGERDSASDIVAWSGLSEGQGTKYIIPAYKYKFEFTDTENADRNVLVESVAWLFDFDDGSEYATNTYMDVVLQLTDAEGKATYFLRNCDTDSIDPCNGSQSGEGAYCAVGDFEVKYDEKEKKYTRNVAIIGNGAALDNFIMSEEDETGFITFQGRNGMLVGDAKGQDREIMDKYHIFGKFSFYKSTFTGMKIQGAGANGNTPAWSFATDPIWGSDTDSNTDKEAIVYFGNDKVIFKPVTISGGVTSVANITKVDTTIPDEAVKVYKDETNTWIAEFKSNYYDLVEFEVTYATATDPITQYINIHRVGIDIETVSGRAGNDVQFMHGTENGPVYKPAKDAETIIYATYYYPELNGTDKLVDLYVTYTWKNGTVTKAVVSNNSELNLNFHHDDTSDLQSSDFVLYEGSSDAAPDKVEVSAVVAGFGDDTSFTGMRLGSGKGVCWSNFVTKQ